MKKLFVCLSALAISCFTGCKTLPTPENMYATAKSIGIAAGYAIEILKIEDSDKAKILEVLSSVKKVVPAEGETYKTAWKRVASEEVEKLIAEKKIKKSVGSIIITAVSTAGSGVDHALKKYAKAKESAEVIQSAISGVVDGVELILKPAGAVKSVSDGIYEIDYEVYFVLSQQLSK